jgi:uncharacterized cupin superfamily protein
VRARMTQIKIFALVRKARAAVTGGLLMIFAVNGHVAVAAGAETVAPAVVRIDSAGLRGAQKSRVESDRHMKLVSGNRPMVADVIVASSANLRNWPVDEFMLFLNGQVEVSNTAGQSRVYGPGNMLVMPRGFTGTWRQLGPIRKLAVAYRPDSNFKSPGGTDAITNIEIVPQAVAERKMQPVRNWGTFMTIVGQSHARFVADQLFSSRDHRFGVNREIFEPVTLKLANWPIDEWMHMLAGEVSLRGPDGKSQRFGPGDTFFLPKGYSGMWVQKKTIDMVTVTYGQTP